MPKRVPGVTDMTPAQKKMYTSGATKYMKESAEERRYRRAMGSQADIVERGNRMQSMEAKDSKVLRSSSTGYGSFRNK
jgi:hypothetical protein